jgi:integrase
MARPPLPLNTHGSVSVRKVAARTHRARCRYRDADGVTRRIEATGSSATAARTALQELIRERRGSSDDTLKPHSRFSLAAKLWLARMADRRKATSVDAYRRRLDGVVLPALGQLRLREVTIARLDAFMAACEARGMSANYRRAIRDAVAGPLELALRHEAIVTNPAEHLDTIEGSAAAPRAFTFEERRRLLAWLDDTSDDPQMAAKQAAARRRDLPDLLRFMLATGTRLGEALAVRECDLDLDGVPVVEGDEIRQVPVVSINATIVRVKGHGLLRVPPKTPSANRTVPLPGFAVTMLRARVATDGGQAPVFAAGGRTGPTWHDPSKITKWLREVFDPLGMDWATSHVCRKTYLTLLDDEHALSDRMKADVMGHASLLRDTYVGRGQLHPQVGPIIDAAYRSA